MTLVLLNTILQARKLRLQELRVEGWFREYSQPDMSDIKLTATSYQVISIVPGALKDVP